MTAFVTKYSLKTGKIVKAEVSETCIPDLVRLGGAFLSSEQGEWFKSEQAALDDVNAQKDDQIKSLEAELSRLKGLTVEVHEEAW